MCNQYMFIFNSKYSSYSLWGGVMRGKLRGLGVRLTRASLCLPQVQASLAWLMATGGPKRCVKAAFQGTADSSRASRVQCVRPPS